jgi:cold shock CspA family protein
VYVAIRDAFDASRRLLEDHVRQGRSEVKLHSVPDHGRVARLLPGQDYGFILSADGNEIYFHRNSVVNGGFGALAIGDEVRFVAQPSESAEGPQASTVVPLGKRHLPPTERVRR